MPHVHVIGAGLAGLSAAVSLSAAGRPVTIYESGSAAGGRCRSYFDKALDCRIDNGNHLLLSGNRSAMEYLETIGAQGTMGGPGAPLFPFIDLRSGERWTLEPSPGRFPWWVFRRSTRVPGTSLHEYLKILSLRHAAADATVGEILDRSGPLYRRLLQPLAVAALNTPPDAALARLLNTVMEETLMQGGASCIPYYPTQGLSESFIDPALAYVAARGGGHRLNHRIAGLRIEDNTVRALLTPDGAVEVAQGDGVVMAVPAWIAPELLPGLVAPDAFESIVNLHFRTDADPGRAGFLGVIGGTAEWIFVKPGVVSITISAANRIVDTTPETLAAVVWPEVRVALDLPEAMPPVRVVKEKRATFSATAAQERRRPRAVTGVSNLALAGDWISTGLPGTIEGAIRSGRAAAEVLLAA